MTSAKIYLYIICFFVFITACNDDKQQAEKLFGEAQSLYESGEYMPAKSMIDSLKKTYPNQFDVLKQGLLLMRKVECNEQEKNISYCDSMIAIKQIETDSLKKFLIFEKDEKYDDIGKYIDKQQKIEQNLQHSYIRSGVNELGEMYIASVYYGGTPIHHTKLKVSNSNGEYMETENIPADGGTNYSFKDGGITTEIVTYQKGKDNGVIQFIYNKVKEPLKAEYIGQKNYSIQISTADKNALAKAYELSVVLSDIELLKTEVEKSKSRINYLKTKLEQQN